MASKKTEVASEVTIEKVQEGSLTISQAFEAAKAEIQRIDERAEYAIQVVTQAIRSRATISKGIVLLNLKEQFKNNPELDGQWTSFLSDLGVHHSLANRWMTAASVVQENAGDFGVDILMEFSPHALAELPRLPQPMAKAVLQEAVETGKPKTIKEVQALATAPTTKRFKTLEELEALASEKDNLKEQLSQVDEDSEDAAVLSSQLKALENRERVLQQEKDALKEEIDEANRQKAQLAEEASALRKELTNLKFDEDAARIQRVKRISHSLPNLLPQALADFQRYLAEKSFYSIDSRQAIDAQAKALLEALKKHYD